MLVPGPNLRGATAPEKETLASTKTIISRTNKTKILRKTLSRQKK